MHLRGRSGICGIVSGLSLATCTACAAWAPPNAKLAQSQATLRAAEAAGAQSVAVAAVHVQLAYQAIERASHLMQKNDNHRATYALMRAEADADLALALAREVPARAEAHDALDKVQSFIQENAL